MIEGYRTVESIYCSQSTEIFRAVRESDGLPVILKLRSSLVSPKSKVDLAHEYEFGKTLDGFYAVKHFALECKTQKLILVFQDDKMCSLESVLPEKGFDLEQFFKLAIEITKAMKEIHAQGIIHKDINPSNIIVNLVLDTVKLIDFELATRISEDAIGFQPPDVLQGTISYISPEQTGRINKPVDSRSDLYSLSVTFYKMLCGRLPFEAQDIIELLHCHIARNPVPVCEVRKDIPQILSDIIAKLMAKNAEDRYQSAGGLLADLNQCREDLEATGKISLFSLASQDISGKFQISQKLYARKAEVEILLESFEKAAQDKTEMLMVSGRPGIGKSALVMEIVKSVTLKNGRFISGKFEQMKRNIPYFGFIQAFQKVIREILSQSDKDIEKWKTRLMNALGANGQVIVDIIPLVEKIIGPQKPAPELGIVENENRFNRVLLNFLGVFLQQETPMVIFLDDVQWADLPSLNLMEKIMTDPDMRYMFFIGAYRDNETDPGHPLMNTLEMIKKTRSVREISLNPLGPKDLNHLIADTLNCQQHSCETLSWLIFQKTNGNPFFVKIFLKTLYDENLISFNTQDKEEGQGKWNWELDAIEAQGITDNVVNLMLEKIQKMPEDSHKILSLASVCGNRFSLSMLSLVSGRSVQSIHQDLWISIQQGLIISGKPNYQSVLKNSEISEDMNFVFLHDRVQQAANLLLDDKDKSVFHLKIGRIMQTQFKAEAFEESLFEAVDHLNKGAALISDPGEKQELAALNLKVAQKAKQSSAYEAALGYIRKAWECLPSVWQDKVRDLGFSIFIQKGEIEFLNAMWDEAIATFDKSLEISEGLLERSRINTHRINLYRMKNDLLKAMEICVLALGELDIHVKAFPEESELMEEIRNFNEFTRDTDPAAYFDLPEMEDVLKLATMGILRETLPVAYFLGSHLLFILSTKMSELSIKYGNSHYSTTGYMFYGALVLSALLNDYDKAEKFGALALKLNDVKYHEKSHEALLMNMWGGFICLHTKPIDTSRKYLMKGYYSGVENGAYQWAGYCAVNNLWMCFWGTDTIDRTLEKIEKITPGLRKIDPNMVQYYYAINAVIYNLTHPVDCKLSLSDSVWPDHNKIIEICRGKNDLLTLFVHATCLLSLANWFSDYQKAEEYALTAEQYLLGATGIFINRAFHFHQTMAYAAVYEDVNSTKQTVYLDKIKANVDALRLWAEYASGTYRHYMLLAEAELARINNNDEKVADFYEEGIESAGENGFIQDKAFACERAEKFHLSRGNHQLAEKYIIEAYDSYTYWGAETKVKELEKKYADLFTTLKTRKTLSAVSMDKSKTSKVYTLEESGTLDMVAVIKASQAISGEIDLKKLLTKMIRIIIENAGAQRGFLIMKRDGDILIQAEDATDMKEAIVLQSVPISRNQSLSEGIIRYALRSGEKVVLDDAVNKGPFTQDAHVLEIKPRSLVCLPFSRQNEITGALYLENNLVTHAFTKARLKILDILISQAIISIENAELFETNLKVRDTLQQKEYIIESASSPIAMADLHGFMLYANPAFLEAWGFEDSAEFQGMHFKEFWIVEDRLDKIMSALQEEGKWSDENLAKRKDGTLFHVHSSAATIFDMEGNPIGLMATSIDITERKRAEAELEKSNSELADHKEHLEEIVKKRTQELKDTQEKLIKKAHKAGMADIATGTLHNIGNILSSVKTSTQFIRNNYKSEFFDKFKKANTLLRENKDNIEDFILHNPKSKKLIQYYLKLEEGIDEDTGIIKEHIDRLSDKVEAIADVIAAQQSYAGAASLTENFNLSDIIEDALTMQQESLSEYNISIEKEFNDIQEVPVQKTKLIHLLVNLINNAKDAMTKISPEKRKLTIMLSSENENVNIKIKDTGIGISSENLQKIFSHGYTTKKDGHGFGLHSCANYMTEMNGRMWAESEGEDKGATFVMAFPKG